MPTVDVNLDAVERRRDRLSEDFGEAPIRTRRDNPDPSTFEEWLELSQEGYVGSAYALVHRYSEQTVALTESMDVEPDAREHVLLITSRGGPEWGLPGGGQEGEETMGQTARREVAEETGVDCTPRSISWLRHEITECEGYDERLLADWHPDS